MIKEKIAILGATSHIAKGLICNFVRKNKYKLFLYARSPERVKDFVRANCPKAEISFINLNDLARKEYDCIINCVGIGIANKIRDNPSLIFSITEEYDKILMANLSKFTKSRCINFSSGAVYGDCFNEPVGDSSVRKISVNNINPQEYYGLAKINSETKHRAQKNLHIVDIRIFAYFSRFIDLDSGYFLTEMIKSIKQGKEFSTNSCDFVRDYLHPADLFALVELIIAKKPLNLAIDAYSRAPVSKFELLDYFSKSFGLKYKIDDKLDFVCPTGAKDVYCSNSRKAVKLGYRPKYTSISVMQEAKFLLP